MVVHNLLSPGWSWIIILIVALLLFGGSRLAGLGKGAGRAIREFKDELKGPDGQASAVKPPTVDVQPQAPTLPTTVVAPIPPASNDQPPTPPTQT